MQCAWQSKKDNNGGRRKVKMYYHGSAKLMKNARCTIDPSRKASSKTKGTKRGVKNISMQHKEEQRNVTPQVRSFVIITIVKQGLVIAVKRNGRRGAKFVHTLLHATGPTPTTFATAKFRITMLGSRYKLCLAVFASAILHRRSFDKAVL